jgi:hypothetical protein
VIEGSTVFIIDEAALAPGWSAMGGLPSTWNGAAGGERAAMWGRLRGGRGDPSAGDRLP